MFRSLIDEYPRGLFEPCDRRDEQDRSVRSFRTVLAEIDSRYARDVYTSQEIYIYSFGRGGLDAVSRLDVSRKETNLSNTFHSQSRIEAAPNLAYSSTRHRMVDSAVRL